MLINGSSSSSSNESGEGQQNALQNGFCGPASYSPTNSVDGSLKLIFKIKKMKKSRFFFSSRFCGSTQQRSF